MDQDLSVGDVGVWSDTKVQLGGAGGGFVADGQQRHRFSPVVTDVVPIRSL